MLLLKDIESKLPNKPSDRKFWNGLCSGSSYLAIANAVLSHAHTTLLICESNSKAIEAETNLRVYLKDKITLLPFPDWETLPWDQFSPHQDIISQRLETLSKLNHDNKSLLICSAQTLMHLLPPKSFVQSQSFILNKGEILNPDDFSNLLINNGYRLSDMVYERGEFARRGSILDLFPMGSEYPVRIELFDDEIETLRSFDIETQRTIETLDCFNILPAKEFPFDADAMRAFRYAWQDSFNVDYNQCPIYLDVKDGIIPNGIEYYLSLFFEKCETLFDYLPEQSLLILEEGVSKSSIQFWENLQTRYENLRYDITRPILAPEKVFIHHEHFTQTVAKFAKIQLKQNGTLDDPTKGEFLFNTKPIPELSADYKLEKQFTKLEQFILEQPEQCFLICAQSSGRREQIIELLHKTDLHYQTVKKIDDFLTSPVKGLSICTANITEGYWLETDPAIIVLSESEIYGYKVTQNKRTTKSDNRSADLIIKNLSELEIGSPVVHIDHGVGRYRGLENLTIDGNEIEFLCMEYANKAKLYVPVSSLHLISRYSGGADQSAPLHTLGSEVWAKARKKAAEKIHDVAAELLDIYAQRAAVKGYAHSLQEKDYLQFSAAFPFEETEDQIQAIEACLADMKSAYPMDRLICGDVGFGKTEVAMRAAFVAIQNHKQVAVLVPTTLLAEQHEQTFKDRFADWPVRIAALSRFNSAKETKGILEDLKLGKIDIVVGTHKLLQNDVRFKDLGLMIIDEEHRFGVRHKEKLKSLRTNVDILTLTATPIPRTLNMAMSGIRDISIIATPPAKRLSIKTFVHTTSNSVIKEAIHRELLRGGQVFYLHNEVSTIEQSAAEIQKLIPEARISIAHGQMPEKQLEKVMSDFYHRQSNILVCTTIIETGIDIPSANTIIIDRADKLGLAQLHQLRGRVGRSHHQAYAYLLTPHHKAMSQDAIKRLEAIQEASNLGAGFTLASHDLEIRGAGELLGDEQSGNMHAIGFTLYMDMLEEAVQSIKAGKIPGDYSVKHGCEINLGLPALIPSDYLPDVHLRLLLYKRISSARQEQELSDIQVEMIDRFGMLPEQVKLLMKITRLKLLAEKIGILKIDAGPQRGKVTFDKKPKIDPLTVVQLVQKQSKHFKMESADKLQYIFDMQDYDARISKLEEILHLLTQKAA